MWPYHPTARPKTIGQGSAVQARLFMNELLTVLLRSASTLLLKSLIRYLIPIHAGDWAYILA